MNELVFRQAENIVTRKVMEDILLVPISGDIAAMDNIFSLNEVGYFIWQQLDGVRTVAEVGRSVQASFDAPAATIQADLFALLTDLAEQKLIERVGGSHDSNA